MIEYYYAKNIIRILLLRVSRTSKQRKSYYRRISKYTHLFLLFFKTKNIFKHTEFQNTKYFFFFSKGRKLNFFQLHQISRLKIIIPSYLLKHTFSGMQVLVDAIAISNYSNSSLHGKSTENYKINKALPKQRKTCHQCGNVRSKIEICRKCPHIYCKNCAVRMKIEYGTHLVNCKSYQAKQNLF